ALRGQGLPGADLSSDEQRAKDAGGADETAGGEVLLPGELAARALHGDAAQQQRGGIEPEQSGRTQRQPVRRGAADHERAGETDEQHPERAQEQPETHAPRIAEIVALRTPTARGRTLTGVVTADVETADAVDRDLVQQ